MLNDIFTNPILVASFIAWFIAQFLKLVLTFVIDKRFDITRMVGSGGMPSSHAALVMGLATSVGLKQGFSSTEYAIAICFALVVMYDASGVRRAVGKQANILNQIIIDMKKFKHIEEKKLKELIGHTPIEVFAGALLGILIANIVI